MSIPRRPAARARLLLLPAAACGAILSASLTAGTSAAAGAAHCPIGSGSPSGGDVQWAFNETGPPSGAHPGIASSYTHGRGSWTSGRATGVACHEDSLTSGRGARELVLKVAGAARLSPGVTRAGLRGVELELKLSVTASNDSACTVGTQGTATLFASYYSVHRDSLRLRFTGSCADHAHTYTGSQLHVLITRHGAQVN